MIHLTSPLRYFTSQSEKLWERVMNVVHTGAAPSYECSVVVVRSFEQAGNPLRMEEVEQLQHPFTPRLG